MKTNHQVFDGAPPDPTVVDVWYCMPPGGGVYDINGNWSNLPYGLRAEEHPSMTIDGLTPQVGDKYLCSGSPGYSWPCGLGLYGVDTFKVFEVNPNIFW